MNKNEWLDVIVKLYPKLHLDERVIHHSNNNDKKKQKILKWLEKIEEIHNIVATKKDKHLEQLYKEMYYNLYVIKEEDIPESYYENEERYERERGRPYIKLTTEAKHQKALELINAQKRSLDKWIEYFLYDEDVKECPMWEKYWVFQGLQNLGKYNNVTKQFFKRDETTVYPFPEVEKEAIFMTLNLMKEYLKDKKGPEEIKNALGSSNFKQLYEYSIEQILLKRRQKNTDTEGVWIKYNQGSDYRELFASLQGHYTGWCTSASEYFAKEQLEEGDFYTYYTKNENDEYKVPRLAIRTGLEHEIVEIRGVAYAQNIETIMLPILNKKLQEFPEGEKYYKKEHDMRYLTNIDNKVKNNQELSLEELKFLYEIDNKIDGFGYVKDPRIKEIKQNRNQKKDLAIIFGCNEEEVGLSTLETDYTSNQKYKIWYGDVNLEEYDLPNKETSIPKIEHRLIGNCYLNKVQIAEKLHLPKVIDGPVWLDTLKSAEELILPKVVKGDLNLRSLEKVESLILPEIVDGRLSLARIKEIDGLLFPEIVNGHLYLNSLKVAKNITLPKTVNGTLLLDSLEKTENLVLPKFVGGNITLDNLKITDGIIFSQEIKGNLEMWGLKVSDDTNLLKIVENLKLLEIKIDGSISIGPIGSYYFKNKQDLEKYISNLNRSHTK